MPKPKIYTEEQRLQKRRESSLKWARKNKSLVNKKSIEWAKNNPQKVKINRQRFYLKNKDNPIFRLSRLWSLMMDRCYNENNKRYSNYGGRGIIICDEWRYNKLSFINWALENNYQFGLKIERKNNNGNYEPNNCIFANDKIQQNNKSNNRKIKYQGKTKTISQWAEYFNIPPCTLWSRIKNGSPIKDIFYPYHLQSHRALIDKYLK